MRKLDHAARYVTLRECRSEFAQKRYDQNEDDISVVNESLEYRGALLRSPLELPGQDRPQLIRTIKELQRKKEELLAIRRHFTQIMLGSTPSPDELRKEFFDIRAVPSVYTARVFGKVVYVELIARLEVAGIRYHLGDWSLMLDLSSDTIKSRQLRSGLTKEIVQSDGYRHGQYNWDFGFCFGDNLDLVDTLVAQGDYVTAIQTAAVYMNDVNPDHREDIDRYYRKVTRRAQRIVR